MNQEHIDKTSNKAKEVSQDHSDLVFLSDQPTNEDLLGIHRIFAQKIIEIVKSNLKPPYVIGIFGCWGVGKSSVIDMVKDEALKNESKIAFSVIDAWRTDKENFTRHFVTQVARDLLKTGRSNAVVKKINTKEAIQKPKFELDRLGWGALSLYILLMVGLICAAIKMYNPDPNVKDLSIADFVVPITAAMSALFFGLIMPRLNRETKVTSEDVNIEDPHRFLEIYFDDIIKKVDAEKICIVLDNLDRVQPQDAIKMVKTIKTFIVDQEENDDEKGKASKEKEEPRKVVFLIPCDDEELSHHLSGIAHIGNSTEFLRKFFNISVRLPPLIDHDIYAYIEQLILETKLPFTEEQIRTVTFVLSRAYGENLRQPKQFLNQYLASFILAKAFEQEGRLKKEIITQNPEMLAIYRILENEFYLIGMPETIDELRQMMNYVPDDKPSKAEQKLYTRRAAFVSGTSPFWEVIQGDVWFALRHLKQPNDMQKIPKFNAMIDAALDLSDDEFIKLVKGSDKKPEWLMDRLFNYSQNVDAQINMATTFLNTAKNLSVSSFPERLNRDIRRFVKTDVHGWERLPGGELYELSLIHQPELITTVFERINNLASTGDDPSRQQFVNGRGISVCQELIAKLLQVEGAETEYRDAIKNILAVFSYHRPLLEIGLEYPELSTSQEMTNALNLWRTDKEVQAKTDKIIICFKHLSNEEQQPLVDQAIQIISEIYEANLESIIPSEALAFSSSLLEEVKTSGLNVDDGQLTARFGQFQSHYQKTNNWKSRYDLILFALKIAEAEHLPSSSQQAKSMLTQWIPEFFASGDLDDIAALLKTKDTSTRVYLIPYLNNAISRNEETCHIVLTNYIHQAAELIPGVLASQPDWIIDWFKKEGKNLGDHKNNIQNSVFRFANDNSHPAVAYECLSYIKVGKLPDLRTARGEHFTALMRQRNLSTAVGLQEVLNLMDLAVYKPNDSQCDQLKSHYSNIELAGVPDAENFNRLVNIVLGSCKEKEPEAEAKPE